MNVQLTRGPRPLVRPARSWRRVVRRTFPLPPLPAWVLAAALLSAVWLLSAALGGGS